MDQILLSLIPELIVLHYLNGFYFYLFSSFCCHFNSDLFSFQNNYCSVHKVLLYYNISLLIDKATRDNK